MGEEINLDLEIHTAEVVVGEKDNMDSKIRMEEKVEEKDNMAFETHTEVKEKEKKVSLDSMTPTAPGIQKDKT